jgi:DeoR family transcriptional regulator, myo-inositol catabolism operon repressor
LDRDGNNQFPDSIRGCIFDWLVHNVKLITSTGISITNGVTNSSPLENEIKQTVVERSSEVFLLVDQIKFDKYALMTYCSLDKIDYLITDFTPVEKYQEFAKLNGIELVTVN